MSEDGINCALANKIRFKSALNMIEPSIFASSYNLDDVYSTSNRKPPSTKSKTSFESPITISAPEF